MDSVSVDELVGELHKHPDNFDFELAKARGMSHYTGWHIRNFLKKNKKIFFREFFTPVRPYQGNCENLFTYSDDGVHHRFSLVGVFDHQHIISKRPVHIWFLDGIIRDPKNPHCWAGQVILNPTLREVMHASPSAYSLLVAHVIENHDAKSVYSRTRPMLLIPGADKNLLKAWEEDMNTYQVNIYGRTHRIEREVYYMTNPLIKGGQ